MTLSKDNLSANKELALRLIGKHCCGAVIGELYEKDGPKFQPILATTWKALADDHYVRLTTSWHFQITPSGWIKALEPTGKLCDGETKKDLGKICAALKGRLERTKGPALVGTHEIVSEKNLPHYWV